MPLTFPSKERDEMVEERGYRTGWKEGYEAGYMYAWHEINEEKAADEEEINNA